MLRRELPVFFALLAIALGSAKADPPEVELLSFRKARAIVHQELDSYENLLFTHAYLTPDQERRAQEHLQAALLAAARVESLDRLNASLGRKALDLVASAAGVTLGAAGLVATLYEGGFAAAAHYFHKPESAAILAVMTAGTAVLSAQMVPLSFRLFFTSVLNSRSRDRLTPAIQDRMARISKVLAPRGERARALEAHERLSQIVERYAQFTRAMEVPIEDRCRAAVTPLDTVR